MFPSTLRFLTATILGLGMAIAARGQTLTAYTEQWPPYNYEEAGELKGISTDLLKAICADAKVVCNFQLVPWARAYRIVGNVPNTVLFTTARKASREKDFLWVGPILPRSTWIFVKSAPDKATSFNRDISQLRFGIVREEAARQDLLLAGVPVNSLIEDSSNSAVLRLLMSDAVDAMVDTEVAMAWNLRSANLPVGAVTKFTKLTEDGAYFFALNPRSDPVTVQRLQTSLDKLRRSGRVDAIVKQYSSVP